MTGEHMCLVRGHGRGRARVLMSHLRVVTFRGRSRWVETWKSAETEEHLRSSKTQARLA